MESDFIRPLICAKDTTIWLAAKPWYHYLIYASVFARSKDARIPQIRHLGLLHTQQAEIPKLRYASVFASCKDARKTYRTKRNGPHRGSAKSCRASMHITVCGRLCTKQRRSHTFRSKISITTKNCDDRCGSNFELPTYQIRLVLVEQCRCTFLKCPDLDVFGS